MRHSIIFFALCVSTLSAIAQPYTIRSLGAGTSAQRLLDDGRILVSGGAAGTASIWHNGVLTPIGVPTGDVPIVTDFNGNGVFVGTTNKFISPGNRIEKAFTWSPGNASITFYDAGSLAVKSGLSRIHPSGLLLGWGKLTPSSFVQTSFRDIGSGAQYLDPIGSPTILSDINALGHSVGSRNGGTDNIVWKSDGSVVNLSGGPGLASAITESSRIFGHASGALKEWNLAGAEVASWDFTGSYITGGINDTNESGLSVGLLQTAGGDLVPFLWAGSGAAIDLRTQVTNSSSYRLLRVDGINASGMMMGTAENLSTGQYEAVAIQAVPEPATLLILGGAIAGLISRRKSIA